MAQSVSVEVNPDLRTLAESVNEGERNSIDANENFGKVDELIKRKRNIKKGFREAV